MVKNFFLILLFLATSGFAINAQTTVIDSFRVDGGFRSFRLYIPATTTQDLRALVLNMHGLGSNAVEQQFYSDFTPVADSVGFYLVMPQGTSINGTAYWNVGFPGYTQANDVKFLSALIDTIIRRYPIDNSRVYATGMSNGGFMSYQLGVELNSKVAAVASVTGSMVPQKFASAMPGRTVPVMQIHGTMDGTVPYSGSSISTHIDTLMKFWVRNNNCISTPVQTPVPNINTADGCTADRFVWSGGRNGATVELFRVNNGGHTWPGSPFTIGTTNQDFSASREIWRFFNQYRLGQFTSVNHSPAAESGLLRISPNPVTNILHIAAPFKGVSTVFDFAGKALLHSSAKDIDVSTLPSGIYLLEYSSDARTSTVRFTKE